MEFSLVLVSGKWTPQAIYIHNNSVGQKDVVLVAEH
jgi:hypothetical protein